MKKSLVGLLCGMLVVLAAFGAIAEAVPARGAWDGDTYHNEFAQLTFTLPENWMALDDTQITAALGASAEALPETTIYDAMALNTTSNTNFSIILEDVSVMGADATEMDYFDILTQQLAVAMPFFTPGEATEAEIAGAAYMMMPFASEEMDMSQYYYLRKAENTMIEIILTIMPGSTETAEDIMANFQ